MSGAKYNGMYVGIVVQNNDPENRGRVKVYVPHVNAGVYENWYGVKKDKSFRFIGRNVDSDLSDILAELKVILPWAEQANPLAGQSSTGRYNAYLNAGSVSDTNTLTNFEPISGYTPSKYSLNKEGIGEKPSRKYEVESLRVSDAFTSAENDGPAGSRRPNKYSYMYRPTSYSNCAKGIFGIPNVGAHVWCFFEDGNPNDPIFFAAAFGKDDWQSIYGNAEDSSQDYPESYENHSAADSDVKDLNIETYRNKFLINQKGGTLEFVNTDSREILKMTHYSGSFKEFNNQTSIELAVKNDQKLVMKDQYLTVNGYQNLYVGRDLDFIVKGDLIHRTGEQNPELHKAWREKARQLADIKQLFEIQRTENSTTTGSVAANFIAPGQSKSGSHAICPVCNKASPKVDYLWRTEDEFGSVGIPRRIHSTNFATNMATIEYAELDSPVFDSFGDGGKVFGSRCPLCNGKGKSPSSLDGNWAAEPNKAADKWLTDTKNVINDLIDIEKSLGMGGSEVISIAKHKTETIGLVMNDFGNIRIDDIGKLYKSHLSILKEGVVNDRTTSPLIEYVHTDDLPGGSYTLNVCNRWNVQVGAGGISMKSYGPVDIGGTIVNMGGEQVNIGSENEVNIDGGRRVSIVGDILTLRQREKKQVLVDSNLGVTQNVIIGGGLHVDGELSLQHVSAPVEIQETEESEIWGKSEWNDEPPHKLIIGYLDDGGYDPSNGKYWNPTPVYCRLSPKDSKPYGILYEADENSTRLYPHSHHFKNLPLHLYKKNSSVRDVGKNCEVADERVGAEAREVVPAKDKLKD